MLVGLIHRCARFPSSCKILLYRWLFISLSEHELFRTRPNAFSFIASFFHLFISKTMYALFFTSPFRTRRFLHLWIAIITGVIVCDVVVVVVYVCFVWQRARFIPQFSTRAHIYFCVMLYTICNAVSGSEFVDACICICILYMYNIIQTQHANVFMCINFFHANTHINPWKRK